MTLAVLFAGASLLAWLYLILLHGGFWLARERDDRDPQPAPGQDFIWPAVTAVIPARNEADMLPRSLPSLINQDYPGPFNIILVDDQSTDGTAEVASGLAQASRRSVQVLRGIPLPAGWTGKVWAMHQGAAEASARSDPPPKFLLFADADIAFSPGALTALVSRAESGSHVLTSLMAKLRCESLAERALIPAFIFFFQMLYPFAWVNRRAARTSAAAGGCMLADRDALARAGGIAAIRDALIDDCALATLMKAYGPVWLGLTNAAVSLRQYPAVGDIRRMVARSAYAQLRYSPLLLSGTFAGMAVVYLAPPLLAVLASGLARSLALLAYGLMTVAFLPTVKFYRQSPLWALALPGIAALYLAFTLNSAYLHWRGKGGMWKGRIQAAPQNL